ncbi:LacI family DNA-binding transcriptional regulator [Pseudarthrobacter sp. BIM B-2242]|uniref:LacI family DNA-binding transcriptional regulator n=1 Tax=Pseudarthrobacter sp. BIM B-2242 TaxID=2772401 RepID=UPI00168B9D79|nr:LacI family DNA-binding transcriptional regulator [Pseudarthrobacter sp. BIM B-2242]QOD03057.1 LacI family DNA-binding transcriptional regulator [Pseudarthrobacter sp. BIM B-2242]
MAKKPTLRDLSEATGLSSYTVSRALSNGADVSAASRKLVLEAARELGYVPNRAAQELRKNTRSSIAVITASTSNYYYLDLMKGIQRVLRASNRNAVVADIAAEGVYTAEVEDATIQDLIQSRTAGIITTLTLSTQNIRLLERWDIPVVFVDSAPPEAATRVPSILTDNYAASMKAGAHLAQHGHTDWLFLAYPGRWSTRAERERGLRDAAIKHGAELQVLETENDSDSAQHALSAYLDSSGRALPRAIIAGNNPLLHGVLTVLQERGTAVPDEVALIAFDEFAWAPLLDPPLTVVDEDSESIGVLAAQILTRILDGQLDAERRGQAPVPDYRPEDRREVSADLIVRRSCGC